MSERRTIVPVSPSLLPRALVVVERVLGTTPHYSSAAMDALRSAVAAPGPNGWALASAGRDTHDIDGVAMCGIFGGTQGAGRLHVVLVEHGARRAGAARALVHAAQGMLSAAGARFVLAELPEDPDALPGGRALLKALGFAEEGRIEDFFRDGVALSFLRRELERR